MDTCMVHIKKTETNVLLILLNEYTFKCKDLEYPECKNNSCIFMTVFGT